MMYHIDIFIVFCLINKYIYTCTLLYYLKYSAFLYLFYSVHFGILFGVYFISLFILHYKYILFFLLRSINALHISKDYQKSNLFYFFIAFCQTPYYVLYLEVGDIMTF